MFQFQLDGPPVPQKQTRFANGHAYNPSSKDIECIRWQVKPTCPQEPLSGPIKLSISFFLPIPKSTSAKVRKQMCNRVILPIKKPDIDNLAYLVTNALKGLVYKDDNQIVCMELFKYYDVSPRTCVTVREIEQIQPIGLHDASDY